MTFWRRAPRSVYQVYDEESYLSGEGAPAGVGEPVASDELVSTGTPAGASGPAGAGGLAGDERERMVALSHGLRTVRLLALSLLGIVTAIAATIVAAQVLHHSQAAPAPVVAHRDRTRSAWTVTPQPSMPVSRERPRSTTRAATVAPAILAPVAPTRPAHISAAASSRDSERSGSSTASPTSPTRLSAGVADAASLPASELPSTDESFSTNALPPEGALPASELPATDESLSAGESHTYGEFGFEQ
jgi:hypothetical protein